MAAVHSRRTSDDLKELIASLSRDHDLGLEHSLEVNSLSRPFNTVLSPEQKLKNECLAKIRFVYWRNGQLDRILQDFRKQATRLRQGWYPDTDSQSHGQDLEVGQIEFRFTTDERHILLMLLQNKLQPEAERLRLQQMAAPRNSTASQRDSVEHNDFGPATTLPSTTQASIRSTDENLATENIQTTSNPRDSSPRKSNGLHDILKKVDDIAVRTELSSQSQQGLDSRLMDMSRAAESSLDSDTEVIQVQSTPDTTYDASQVESSQGNTSFSSFFSSIFSNFSVNSSQSFSSIGTQTQENEPSGGADSYYGSDTDGFESATDVIEDDLEYNEEDDDLTKPMSELQLGHKARCLQHSTSTGSNPRSHPSFCTCVDTGNMPQLDSSVQEDSSSSMHHENLTETSDSDYGSDIELDESDLEQLDSTVHLFQEQVRLSQESTGQENSMLSQESHASTEVEDLHSDSRDAATSSIGTMIHRPELDLSEVETEHGLYPTLPSLEPVLSQNSALARFRTELENLPLELPRSFDKFSFPVKYEVLRVFQHTSKPIPEVNVPSPENLTYDQLWAFLKASPDLVGTQFPPKCDSQTWNATKTNFADGFKAVVLSANLQFHPVSGALMFNLKRMTLHLSHRLGRQFGHDRFLEMNIPRLSKSDFPVYLQPCYEEAKALLLKWLRSSHRILDRIYESFYIKAKDRRANRKSAAEAKEEQRQILRETLTEAEIITEKSNGYAVYFFATHLNMCQKDSTVPSEPISFPNVDIKTLLEWVRPAEKNKSELFPKLFARTALALSRTYATTVLERDQIIEEVGIYNEKDDMTDGAGRMSWALAMDIKRHLNLPEVPSGFQGRIGSAKGFWSVEPACAESNIWIKTTKSQRKWEEDASRSNYNDVGQRTFEVIEWSSPLRTSTLNLQLIPILEDRETSFHAMRQAIVVLLEARLEQEMTDMLKAIEDPRSLLSWIHEQEPYVARASVTFDGGLPASYKARLYFLLTAGFDPKHLNFLNDLIFEVVSEKWKMLETGFHLPLSRSTSAFMVPDFSGKLKADEVHIAFSRPFIDPETGYSRNFLHDIDVLVARSPAHLPTDIQKVKAVFKVELAHLQDVIVFSTQGRPSLASKLSGGDYDGDRAWVCWETSIVGVFTNSKPHQEPKFVQLGYIDVIKTKYSELAQDSAAHVAAFLDRAFEFTMQDSLLGICSKSKEEFCYTARSIRSREALYLSTLLGCLVDQAKQGYIFTQKHWDKFRENLINGPNVKPAYKVGEYQHGRTGHIIDELILDVVPRKIDSALRSVTASLWTNGISTRDDDLLKLADWASKHKCAHKEVRDIIHQLETDLRKAYENWRRRTGEKQSKYIPIVISCHHEWKSIQPAFENTTSVMLLGHEPEHEYSLWNLLKASITYGIWSMHKYPWDMCGKQLAHLKAHANGPTPFKADMYAVLKPDGKYIKRLMDGIKEPVSKGEVTYLPPSESSGESSDDEEYYDCF